MGVVFQVRQRGRRGKRWSGGGGVGLGCGVVLGQRRQWGQGRKGANVRGVRFRNQLGRKPALQKFNIDKKKSKSIFYSILLSEFKM